MLLLSVLGAGWSPAFAAPYSSQEMTSVRTDNEKKLDDLRLREINEIRTVLGRRLEQNRRVDLYIRLAETYLEQYRAEFLIEGKAHEKRLAEGRADPFIDRTHSRPYLREGIKACEEVIKAGVEHPKMDQIYYFLGVNYDELEDSANAIKAFRALTSRYPKSPYAGEAWRALAEEAYGKNKFRDALAYYQAAARNYQGAAYPRLLQKTAWAHYRLREYDKAIDTMKQSVTAAQTNDRFLSLKEEALRDLGLFYMEKGNVNEAVEYFKTVSGDKDYFPKVLERLGAQYERNADRDKAIQVYEMLLKTHPKDESGFRVRAKMIELDVNQKAYSKAIGRYADVQVPTKGEEETLQSARELKALTRKTGVDQHDRYRKTQDQTALVNAENFYSLYLNKFLSVSDPANEKGEIQMYLAEVKKDLGKTDEAAYLYRTVIDSKDARYSKQASALWMDSLSQSVKTAKNKGAKIEDLRKLESDYLDASKDVVEQYGDTREGLQARLNSAQVLAARKDRQDDAEKLIREIIAKAPKSPQALTGARLLVQMKSDQLPAKADQSKDAPEVLALLKTVSELRGNLPLMAADEEIGKNELSNQMAGIENKIKIGVIANQERKKDYNAAGQSYEEFAKSEQKRVVAEKAYENAVASYLKVGEYNDAVRVLRDWMTRYPDSKTVFESIRNSATHAMIAGQFEQAALLFRALGKRNDPNALEASGRLFEGTGNLTQAKEDFKTYLQKYPKAPNRGAVSQSLAQWYEYGGDDSQAIDFYSQCLRGDTEYSAECGARLGDLYARLANPGKAAQFYNQVADRGKTKKDSSPWVGYVRYKLVEAFEREKTFSQPLQLPDDRLKRGLEERLKFLETLNGRYQTVVEASGPWAIAALDRLALWVMNFADEIDQISPPSTANADSIQGFKASLKSISDPLRAKAAESWRTAYQKAVAQDLLSPVLPTIGDRLARAGISPPARAQGFRDKFRLSGQAADGGREGKGAAFERVRQTLYSNPRDVASWIDYGNLLWGDGKPLLAKIAYERALTLDPKASAALNNRGVLIVSASGQEDWIRAAEADAFFRQALAKDELFLAAKFNRGALLNYYRLFDKSRSLWRQVAVVAPQSDALDGLAIAEQGLGDATLAKATFDRSTKAGASSNRVSNLFHEAARVATKNSSECLKVVRKLEDQTLQGFERSAVQNLKQFCVEKEAAKP